VLSTSKVALGPAAAAEFPTASTAVPAARLIASVPSPEMLPTVTVRVVALTVWTDTVPVAVPVGINVTFPAASVMLEAPPYVIV
jgi:hypothetical protein